MNFSSVRDKFHHPLHQRIRQCFCILDDLSSVFFEIIFHGKVQRSSNRSSRVVVRASLQPWKNSLVNFFSEQRIFFQSSLSHHYYRSPRSSQSLVSRSHDNIHIRHRVRMFSRNYQPSHMSNVCCKISSNLISNLRKLFERELSDIRTSANPNQLWFVLQSQSPDFFNVNVPILFDMILDRIIEYP